MSVILVIQPDHAQAKVLRDVARTIHAELEIVDSTARAVDAIARRIPDLILVSPFLSPRDEDTLMARLRSLDGASHVQTVSIPQFCTTIESAPSKKSAFGFGKKKKAAVPVGADPVAFAGEVAALLTRATEVHKRAAGAPPAASKAEPQHVLAAPVGPVWEAAPEPVWEMGSPALAETAENELGETADSEDDFLSVFTADMPAEPESGDSVLAEPIEPLGVIEPEIAEAAVVVEPEVAELSVVERPAAAAPASSIADEIDQLVRQLGLDVSMQRAAESAAPLMHASSEDDPFDFGASLDRARNGREHLPSPQPPQIDADAIREAAVAEARATAEREAREASAAEIARVLAEAESLREKAIAEARAAAETEARQALAADRLRVQAETEQMRETAIAEARAAAEREARDTLAAEVARVRSEAELSFSDALNKVKVEAEEAERRGVEAERAKAKQLNEEAQKAFALELARVRAEVEESLTAQLDAARAEAERIRLAEAEAVRARAAVEHQLKADIERLRFVTAQTRKADETETKRAAQLIKQLEAELATVRAKAEERKGNELEEIRAQMAEMREAAAEHARAAAAEAVAAEVARATAEAAAAVPVPRPTAVIAQFPVRDFVVDADEEDEEDVVAERHVSDYLRLWETNTPATASADVDTSEAPLESLVTAENLRRHAKWALPLAACLLVVANTGTAISTVSRLVRPEERPALTVQAMHEDTPFIEVVEKRVGSLNVKSTPPGADAILDGKRYGRTPVTIPDLDVGLHTLVLKGTSGSITRKVTIKANQSTELNESIYSGWLAIFSPIPVSVTIDGQPVNLTDDARIMTSPGRHVVEFRNDQFSFRATETLEVRPGSTTAHTLVLPKGTLKVRAPEGAEVRVNGEPATGVASEGLQVAIGAHEVTAVHPSLGARRASVDVKHGGVTEVTLQFGQ